MPDTARLLHSYAADPNASALEAPSEHDAVIFPFRGDFAFRFQIAKGSLPVAVGAGVSTSIPAVGLPQCDCDPYFSCIRVVIEDEDQI